MDKHMNLTYLEQPGLVNDAIFTPREEKNT